MSRSGRAAAALLAALVLLCAVAHASGSRSLLSERSLLQKKNSCNTVHPACTSCKATRVTGNSTTNSTTGGGGKNSKTVLVCTACAAGFSLRKSNPFFCDCSPGFMASTSTNGTVSCATCAKGKICKGAGRNGEALIEECPVGLTTYINGAKSQKQCLTLAGYGRVTKRGPNGEVTYESVLCPPGTYSRGKGSGGCAKCGSGLTTRNNGSSSEQECGAAAGSYVRNGVAAKCPKGTFSTAFNNASFCSACGTGLTTAGEGSSAAAACGLAIRGRYLDPVTKQAVLCPLNTYSDEESDSATCKPCLNGWRTENEGSEGVDSCVAPPGYELQAGATNISMCAVGWHKEGWNRNPCKLCGENITTEATGSTGPDDCYLPPGYGIVPASLSSGLLRAQLCQANSYGYDSPMYNIKTSTCNACPPNMLTLDALNGTASDGGYTSIEACLLQPGWGMEPSGSAELCRPGSWNAGYNREACTPCPTSMRTLTEGASSVTECVTVPGWTRDATSGLLKPCDKGTYGLGGSASDRYGNCTACPVGFTTQVDEATSVEDCAVCGEGYGGTNCTTCGHGTYGVGGTNSPCAACPAGTTSARGARSSGECLAEWPLAASAAPVYIALSDEAGWTSLGGAAAASEPACRAACGATTDCVLYRHNADSVTPRCDGLVANAASPSPRAALGFKAWTQGASADFSFAYVPANLTVGSLLRNGALGGGQSLAACMDACAAREDCLLLRAVGDATSLFSCSLYGGALDPDWESGYRIVGTRLASDGFAVSTSS